MFRGYLRELQVRHGDFFQLVDEEIAAATLIFLQAGLEEKSLDGSWGE